MQLEKQMREASRMLEFEYAAVLRDRIVKLRGGESGKSPSAGKRTKKNASPFPEKKKRGRSKDAE